MRNRGFSLVQVMIAFAMTGGLTLVIMNLTEQGAKTQRTMELNQSIIELTNRIASIISDKEACSTMFSNFSVGDDLKQLRINQTSAGLIAEVGEEIGNTKIAITGMQIISATPMGDPNDKDFAGNYELVLRVTFQKGVRGSVSSLSFISSAYATSKATPIPTATVAAKKRTFYGGATIKKDFTFRAQLCSFEIDQSGSLIGIKAQCNIARGNDPFNYYEEDVHVQSVPGLGFVNVCYTCGTGKPVNECI